MALIDRISKLKHPGVLHDFTWPQDLVTFGRYNLIYGWNGSGKTTISRLFHAIETRTAPTNYEAGVCVYGQVLHSSDFSQATLPVRVFNRDFVAANVTQSPGGDVPPILVLGEDSVEKQAQVEVFRASLREAVVERDKRRVQSASDERSLDGHCISEARVVKDTLRSTGQNPYNNFDKSHYKSRAQEMLNSGNGGDHRLADDLRTSLSLRIHEPRKEQIGEIKYRFPMLSGISYDVIRLLETTVVSATIQLLEHDEKLSSWVYEGIDLHNSYSTMQCLFCEQTLPQDRMDKLKAHFNSAYEELIENIDEQIEVLQLTAKETASLELPHGSQFYDDLAKGYEEALAEFSRMQQEASEVLSALLACGGWLEILTHSEPARGAPLIGYVYWYPFVDLDDDNWPDTNERLYDYRQYSGIDRLGQAEFFFWIDPEEYFGERDLDVPDEMTVGIRAELYWSDPIEPRVTRRAEVDTTITTPSE